MEMEQSWQRSPFLAKINSKKNCFLDRNVFCLVFFFLNLFFTHSSQKGVRLLREDEKLALLPCLTLEPSKRGWDGDNTGARWAMKQSPHPKRSRRVSLTIHEQGIACVWLIKIGRRREEKKMLSFVIYNFSSLMLGWLVNDYICLPLNLHLFLLDCSLHETQWGNILDPSFSSSTLRNLQQLLKTCKFLDLQNHSLNFTWKYSQHKLWAQKHFRELTFSFLF